MDRKPGMADGRTSSSDGRRDSPGEEATPPSFSGMLLRGMRDTFWESVLQIAGRIIFHALGKALRIFGSACDHLS